MTKRYFVMLQQGNGTPAPMEDEEDVALFDTEAEADQFAVRNPLGHAYGWQVYEWWTEP